MLSRLLFIDSIRVYSVHRGTSRLYFVLYLLASQPDKVVTHAWEQNLSNRRVQKRYFIKAWMERVAGRQCETVFVRVSASERVSLCASGRQASVAVCVAPAPVPHSFCLALSHPRRLSLSNSKHLFIALTNYAHTIGRPLSHSHSLLVYLSRSPSYFKYC